MNHQLLIANENVKFLEDAPTGVTVLLLELVIWRLVTEEEEHLEDIFLVQEIVWWVEEMEIKTYCHLYK